MLNAETARHILELCNLVKHFRRRASLPYRYCHSNPGCRTGKCLPRRTRDLSSAGWNNTYPIRARTLRVQTYLEIWLAQSGAVSCLSRPQSSGVIHCLFQSVAHANHQEYKMQDCVRLDIAPLFCK